MLAIRRLAIPVLATIWAASALFALPAEATVYKALRDWSVTCTNGLTCTLEFSKSVGDTYWSVALKRSGAPAAPVELLLSASAATGAKAASSDTFRLTVDDAEPLTIAVAAMTADDFSLTYSDPDKVAALLAAMEQGRTLAVRYAGEAKTASVAVSLSGVKAGLLFIDDVQGRVGRVDALVAKGDRAAPAKALVRDLVSFADLPAAIRPDFEDDGAECGGIEPDRFAELGPFSADLGDGVVLYGLPCGPPGAYNLPYVFYAGTDGAVRQLALPVIGDDGPTVERIAFNVGYDAGKRRVTAFYKGRGLGDCGGYDVWTLAVGPAGPAFTLRQERRKDDCDGKYAGGPEHWPSIWPPTP